MAARNSAFVTIFFVVSLCISAVSSRNRSSIKGIFRSRREVCMDGIYTVNGQNCCMCAAGQQVEKPCVSSPSDGKCKICDIGTFNSEPNFETKCLPCTSCAHPNANLEEEEPCTAVRNTKCRCKEGYFCSSKECIICHPCSTCGFGGIKEDCSPTSDTVCSDAAGASAAIVVAIVILVIGAIVAAGYVVIWRKRKRQKEQEEKGESSPHVAIPLLPDDGDIMRHLPDIASELGWLDMKNIAIRMGVGISTIESCELDNQINAEERTLQLLIIWVEKEGKEAPQKMIQTLEKMNKKYKAEKISDILSKANSTSSDNSGTNN